MQIEPLITLSGWKRRGLAALLGVCAAATLPPFYVLPLLIPAFSGLLLMVQRAPTRRQAFLDGWWWGLGHFTAGLYWICISLWVAPEQFAWATPLALFGLPSVLAIYIGLVTLALYSSVEKGEGRGARSCYLPLIFAALWSIAEYARAHLFTGFPWNLIGYAWTVTDATLQFVSVAGIYGMGWMAVLVSSMPALFFFSDPAAAKRYNCTAAFLLAAMALFGIVRLENHPTRYTGVRVRIVQAGIAQSLKWDPKAVMLGLQKHIRLTRKPGLDKIQLVLWPETAVPYYMHSQTPLTQDLGSVLPPGALLVTGGLRATADERDAWNSAFAIDGGGNIVSEYDKHHLVPFGEYIPLRDVPPIGAIAKAVAPQMGDFSRGPGPRTLAIGSYPPFSPLICYEAIFPGEATDGTGRAEWLLSLTDDAWFGVSTGPYQDFQMARTRAVEQGLPLLRAANTGVSGAVDAYGRTLAYMGLEKRGVIDLYLPKEEAQEATIARHPAGGIILICVASMFFLCQRPKKT